MSKFKIIDKDTMLIPYEGFFYDIYQHSLAVKNRLLTGYDSLTEFASAHEYFGLHFKDNQWVFREWAPNARWICLIGPFSGWKPNADYALQQIGQGNWEIKLPAHALQHGGLYKLWVEWPGGAGERLPAYVRRAVQDYQTNIFSAQVWKPEKEYCWRVKYFKPRREPLLIYEAHVGMAQEEGKVGSFKEFRERILPRIVRAGYTAIQLMAVQEHPYYASFGYQVSNFFAASSRFGTPEELKELIDAAHEEGLIVFMDLVHSHAVKNDLEGLSHFDGTDYQYFHRGGRGWHPVWDSRLFDYGKTEVIRFLLSNIRYWAEEFKFDGFRFDGVTSMLYYDHGFGAPFTSFESYFHNRVDRDALTYLCLANDLAHELGKINIAEDVSGLPGLAAPRESGGFGFDYRLAMGIPDYWIKTIKQKRDEDWNVEEIFYELTNRRHDEKTISYVECHDQALVGDQTIFFRLVGDAIYHNMRVDLRNEQIDRGLALHRLIRLITLATAGDGYLNFMGNEFGHPEWIDFPRAGNNWSYHYARRQWSLVDNQELLYSRLAEFDRQIIALAKGYDLFRSGPALKFHSHVSNQTLAFSRANLIFLFNFSPTRSYPDFPLEVYGGVYRIVVHSDEIMFGGHGRIAPNQRFFSLPGPGDKLQIKVYLPSRTAMVLEKE